MVVTFFALLLNPFLNLPIDFVFWLADWSKNYGLGVPAWEEGYQIVIDQFTC